jgi:hypothetical protein
MPPTPDIALEVIEALREQWRADHVARMERWAHLGTQEYQDELTEWLLAKTHSDLEPPWLKPPVFDDKNPEVEPHIETLEEE